MLSAARMARLSRLVDEALELNAEARRRWLEALSPDDRDLEPGLRHALFPEESRDASGDLLTRLPALGATRGAGSVSSGLQPGERIGPYLLTRRLGEGGMAEVWLAERADGAFKREVALKLPMLSQLRMDLESRFARERDILAGLEHPNIARLYDAGVTAKGLPYLAMEFVAGEPLAGWCDTHHLGIRERLELFLQVLDAVQYAHGHQVIHLDIKPSNILVTESGQVRLLDFGVAKLLANEDEQTNLTRLFGKALTPDYASPELVRGDPIGPPADVYSLGVVLYELLAGRRPYRLKAGMQMLRLEEAVGNAQIERPSRRLGPEAGSTRGVTQEALARKLRGDLDAVVMKALAKAPADRYDSATALADDLRRHLHGKPVQARPDTWVYRLSKVILRHRTATAAALVTLAITASMAYELVRRGAISGPPQLTQADDLARASAIPAPLPADDKSLAVLPFVDMSEQHDQEYLSDGLSEEMIDRLSHSPDLRVVSRTSSFYFKGKQATISEIASKLNVSYVLEGSVRKVGSALRIAVQLIRALDGASLWSQTYDRKLSDIFKLQDEIAGTVAASLKAALNERTSRASAARPDPQAYSLLLQGNYFLARYTKPDTEKAIEYYRKAIATDPNYALPWAKLADADINRANNNWAPVIDASERARNELQRALRIDPNSTEAHRLLGELYATFDWDWDQAQREYQRAQELDPSDARSRMNQSEMDMFRFGRFDERIAQLRLALARDPLDTNALSNLGWTLFYAVRLEESAAASRHLLELNPSFAGAGARLAYSLLLTGKPLEALTAAESEADESWRLSTLPAVYWALGRRFESDQTLRQLEQNYAAGCAYNIAQMRAYRGEVDAAFAWLDRAHKQRDGGMVESRIHPLLRNLRADPRYQSLLVEMKLAG
jgi:eukaryotic-like serine/threonine-protein kinase